MKILHTADWHIGQFKGPVVDGVNLRSQDTVKCLEYMVQVAIEEKPDIVCVSGDIFHQEQVGPVRYSDEMITATNIITSLAHFSKYVIVMRGTPNHDGAAQFRVLERMLLNIRNVDVVTEPGVIKTPLFSVALGAFLDVICETFNNQGIPSLIDINGSHFDGIEDYPTLAHGDVDKRDITKLSTFLKDMVGTGILIPDEELEDYVREAANLPERTEVPDSREKDERREAQRRAPEKTANEPDGPEVDPEENQDAEEAKKRLGR